MKFTGITFVVLSLVASAVAVRHGHANQRSIQIVGTIEDINFGPLENAPNGHISFRRNPGGARLWVPGRLSTGPNSHEEGGFLFDLPNWSADALAQAQPTFTFGHVVPDEQNPVCTAYIFDGNYAAMNAVIPASEPGTLLAFYDAEYHEECTSEPLLSSIGIATSTDGGISWQNRQQVIQGLDEANFTTQSVLDAQDYGYDQDPKQIIDSGSSGPSAVVREADGGVYIYLYYADRKPLTGGRDSIYVARALLSSDGQPGNWQKWDGNTWGAIGDQTGAKPIVKPTPYDVLALQPHVSWNTALRLWLMVFKTANDFQVTTSADGINWNIPVSLLSFPTGTKLAGFPTLISLNGGTCDGCEDDNQSSSSRLNSRSEASQQVTGANGWLYYSSLLTGDHQYHAHRVAFRISDG